MKNINAFFYCVFLGICLYSSSNMADTHLTRYQQINRLLQLRQYQQVVDLLTPLAQQGDARAQYQLAGMYRSGRGLEKDYKQAVYWFAKAAQHNHADAIYSLALMVKNGLGTEKNPHKALSLLRKAAKLGNKKAEKYLEKYAGKDKATVEKMLLAAQKGQISVLRQQIQAGINPDAQDKKGQSALILASRYGNQEIVAYLLAKGVNTRKRTLSGENAFLLAVRGGYTKIARLLLQADKGLV